MKILIINMGSTSTKISVYENETELYTESVFHDADELNAFEKVNQQLPLRMEVVFDLLRQWHISIEEIDAVAARGGSAYPQPSGVIEIDERLYEDTKNAVWGGEHPSKLGVMMAYELYRQYGIHGYTMDSINTDEFCDYARITGIKGVYRKPQTHALNQKAVARAYCEENGIDYSEVNLIVCHIDGGITVTAHHKGRMVDSNIGSSGDGPFTPTRIGSVPVSELLNYLKNHDLEKTRDMCSRSGGFVSFFGTSNGDEIHRMVMEGNETAKLVWNAMIYNIAKEIGAMSAVLKGDVKAILISGGFIRFDDLVKQLKDYTSYIAPIILCKDREQSTLAVETFRALTGQREIHQYRPYPVFKGFKGIDY